MFLVCALWCCSYLSEYYRFDCLAIPRPPRNLSAGYVLALDMTARDLQDAAKKQGLPWSVAKGFGTSCPVSSFVPAAAVSNPHDVTLWLNVRLAHFGSVK
jgi:hypothetical protein